MSVDSIPCSVGKSHLLLSFHNSANTCRMPGMSQAQCWALGTQAWIGTISSPLQSSQSSWEVEAPTDSCTMPW